MEPFFQDLRLPHGHKGGQHQQGDPPPATLAIQDACAHSSPNTERLPRQRLHFTTTSATYSCLSISPGRCPVILQGRRNWHVEGGIAGSVLLARPISSLLRSAICLQ